MEKYFILRWNEEYLDAELVSGPLEKNECAENFRRCIISALLQLQIVNSEKEAQIMYDKELHTEVGLAEPGEILSISPDSGSISYGNYNEYYRIKSYDIPDKLMSSSQKHSDWILTDDDSFQICRNVENIFKDMGPVYELYQVQAVTDDDDKCYKVAHEYVFVNDINIDDILDCYGYRSIDDISDDKNTMEQILAEYSFELTAASWENLLSTPLLSYNEARAIISALSGYECTV